MTYAKYAVDISTLVHDRIVDEIGTTVYPQANIGRTYFPRTKLEDLAEQPHVWVVTMPFDEDRVLRSKGSILDLSVQITLQKKVDPSDDIALTSECDQLSIFVEELGNICRHDFPVQISGHKFSFGGTSPLRDDNGNLFSYEDMYNKHVFNAIFTAAYQTGKE